MDATGIDTLAEQVLTDTLHPLERQGLIGPGGAQLVGIAVEVDFVMGILLQQLEYLVEFGVLVLVELMLAIVEGDIQRGDVAAQQEFDFPRMKPERGEWGGEFQFPEADLMLVVVAAGSGGDAPVESGFTPEDVLHDIILIGQHLFSVEVYADHLPGMVPVDSQFVQVAVFDIGDDDGAFQVVAVVHKAVLQQGDMIFGRIVEMFVFPGVDLDPDGRPQAGKAHPLPLVAGDALVRGKGKDNPVSTPHIVAAKHQLHLHLERAAQVDGLPVPGRPACPIDRRGKPHTLIANDHRIARQYKVVHANHRLLGPAGQRRQRHHYGYQDGFKSRCKHCICHEI